MKRIATVLFLVAITAAGASAQEFKTFRVGLGAGYAMPGGKGAKAGALFTSNLATGSVISFWRTSAWNGPLSPGVLPMNNLQKLM